MSYTGRPPKLVVAFGSATATGDTTLIPAIAGVKFRIWGLIFSSTAGNNVEFRSSTTPISASLHASANKEFVVMPTDWPWMECAKGEAFVINMTSATQTGVQILYDQVT